MFTDKYMGSITQIIDSLVLDLKPPFQKPLFGGEGGWGTGGYGPGTGIRNSLRLRSWFILPLCALEAKSSANPCGTASGTRVAVASRSFDAAAFGEAGVSTPAKAHPHFSRINQRDRVAFAERIGLLRQVTWRFPGPENPDIGCPDSGSSSRDSGHLPESYICS
jgi:hypothetical protein